MTYAQWLDLTLAQAYEVGLVPAQIARMTPRELIDVIGGRYRQAHKQMKDWSLILQRLFTSGG